MIFVELTSSIRFAVVTSSLNGEWVELSLTNKNNILNRIFSIFICVFPYVFFILIR